MSGEEMTTPNGNGYTTKEVLSRVEGKMDAFISTHSTQHSDLMRVVQTMQLELATHMADRHSETVKALDDESKKESGRRDMLRVIFGTSIAALVTGVGGLVIAVLKFMEGK